MAASISCRGRKMCIRDSHKVTRSDEQPTEGVWYQDAKGRYYTYPDDWTDSFYGCLLYTSL